MWISPALLTAAAALTGISSALPSKHDGHCGPLKGNFTIKKYQLYPENADFDPDNCVLYLGQLWNASLGVYDPFKDKYLETIEFDGISHNPAFHLGGVGFDKRTGLLSMVADAAPTFGTLGQDISGTNWLMKYDPKSHTMIYKINLTESSQGKYGGFQDVEQDPEGNVYVIGTFPSTITKVSKDGKTVVPWYLPEVIDHTKRGTGGLAALDWMLLVQGDQSGAIWRFDMRAEKGVPHPVKIVSGNHTFGDSDAIYLPPKYKGTVLLVAEDSAGISVFRSKDAKWETAEYKGIITGANADIFNTAPIQIGESVYTILEPFGDAGLGGPGTAGNRTDFVVRDISEEVERLLAL
ncbi:uncharacterized protein BDR25DRAFT_379390 [Lindgomyces ingoldianus]|uniref:Uncharacterized protein n=1 Tax=Lindgomyces ingoldianus TaxID=673940 RepID=A0ACB6R9V2_9PLEO|nr:uncharacterized protein BDR25DRAFT_379390 [Lindgomyces ingoldianus]KAF2475830.1 hypothetical protein BDR25DRAFT_379390 [Lindgomyces ingoldianus]